MRSLKPFGLLHFHTEILRSYSRDALEIFHAIYYQRYMNSDGDVDPLNPGCSYTNPIIMNHHATPREQRQASSNRLPAKQMSEIEDDVVETSDQEELAFDLALQQPSYWLAPSLYPLHQTTDSTSPCFSQQAIGSSSAQPSTVRSVLSASRFI